MPVRRPLSAINPQIAPRVASKETRPLQVYLEVVRLRLS